MEVEADGNRPAKSRIQAIQDLKTHIPNTLEDLRKLIGFNGFHQDWIPNYKLHITQWQQHIKTLRTQEQAHGEGNDVGNL